MMLRMLLAGLLALFAAAPAYPDWPARNAVQICPATPDQTGPPDFGSQTCRTTSLSSADAQGRAVWMQFIIEIDEAPSALTGPYALFLSGKMAAQAHVNGVSIGSNGEPGFRAADETPGLMDAALFLPAQLLRSGENRIVLLASGHHSQITLSRPTHKVAIGPFRDPRRAMLAAYQGALITLGVFALAVIFFSTLAILSARPRLRLLLAAIALLGGLQLIAETGRGLVAYTYPVHDLRLMAIAGVAGLLSLAIAGWSALRFSPGRPWVNLAALGLLTVAVAGALLLVPGFDQKASYPLIFGAAMAAGPPAWRAFEASAWAPSLWAAAFAGFAVSGALSQQTLLDLSLFWALSALLLANIVAEARGFAAERKARLAEGRRADALASALARAEQAARPVQIALISAGRTDYADAADIARLDAADDYVEVRFEDGRMVLHTGTLAGLEEQLPANFLRVHRSCIVNTDQIAALEREPNGSGRLILKSAGEAPVSRRILPTVKAALSTR